MDVEKIKKIKIIRWDEVVSYIEKLIEEYKNDN